MSLKTFIVKSVVLTIIATLSLTACRSSRTSIKGSDGKVTSISDDKYYDNMRNEVDERAYDIPQIGALVSEAARWLGTPYKYGGNNKSGVDCSGLTLQVYQKTLGVKMPRTSREQQMWCIKVERDNIMPGDLIFFATGSNRSRVSHVGLYIGNGDIIHASSSRGVIVSNLEEPYYLQRYHSSGRPEILQRIYSSSADKSNSSADKSDKPKSTGNSTKAGQQPPQSAPSITLDQWLNAVCDSVSETEHQVAPPTLSTPINNDSIMPIEKPNEPTDSLTPLIEFFD